MVTLVEGNGGASLQMLSQHLRQVRRVYGEAIPAPPIWRVLLGRQDLPDRAMQFHV